MKLDWEMAGRGASVETGQDDREEECGVQFTEVERDSKQNNSSSSNS
jgi:hypothetical protein